MDDSELSDEDDQSLSTYASKQITDHSTKAAAAGASSKRKRVYRWKKIDNDLPNVTFNGTFSDPLE